MRLWWIVSTWSCSHFTRHWSNCLNLCISIETPCHVPLLKGSLGIKSSHKLSHFTWHMHCLNNIFISFEIIALFLESLYIISSKLRLIRKSCNLCTHFSWKDCIWLSFHLYSYIWLCNINIENIWPSYTSRLIQIGITA